VALTDDFDPMFLAAFRAQPPDRAPVPALRAAAREVFSQLSPADLADIRQRTQLILSVPELRAATIDGFIGTMRLLAKVVAERVGRQPDELAIRVLVGATIGAWTAAVLDAVEDPNVDLLARMDEAIALLEAGLPL
jgi:hypothetical protein